MLSLTLDRGGSAEVIETDGSHVALRSSHAAPPGSILSGKAEGQARPYRVKVRGCRRIDAAGEAPFRVEGRFVDLTREQRDALTAPPDRPAG